MAGDGGHPARWLGPAQLREVFTRHDFHPSRAFGQNFVIDPNTIRKIVALSGVTPGDVVLEVGPGAGSLTVALAGAARRVVALEIDRRLIAVLHETLQGLDNVEVIRADAMRADLGATPANLVVANLPYNIASGFVLRALQEVPAIEALTVMVQKEVGERLAARAGSKTYGQTSALVAFHAQAEIAASVSRRAFWPVPAVDSVIVRMLRRPQPEGVDPGAFVRVVRGAFSQRRKTLAAALASLYGSVESARAACRDAGVDPGARAEQLELPAFVELAQALPGGVRRPANG